MMKKKYSPPIPKPKSDMKDYQCRWCGEIKREDKYFKCSIDHGAVICIDCAKKKYKKLNEVCDKHIAIFLMCHHLNLMYDFRIYQSLDITQGIGYYIRMLNLKQNNNPKSFEEGFIKNSVNTFVSPDVRISMAKDILSEIIVDLDKIKNVVEDVKNDL